MKKLVIGIIIAIIVIGGIAAAIATDVIDLDDDKDKKEEVEEEPETVVAVIKANLTSVKVYDNITFDASGSQGNITTYIWDFGDNNKGDNVTEIHSYSNGGRYLVNLTVMSDSGATNSTTIYIGVTYHQEENGTFILLPDSDNATVPVEEGASDMNITLTLTPWIGQSVTLDITVYDSNNTAIYNATHEGVTQQETFYHTIPELLIYGNYNIELYCRQGSTDYDMAIDVHY